MIQKIKELRDRTGAGMMDCKKAINETNGDIDKAIKWLREKGISKAAKKAGNVSAEGATSAAAKGNNAIIVEVNAQTDFVAKNDQFQNLVKEITTLLLNELPKDLDAALKLKTKDGTLQDTITQATATIGENIVLRRFEVVTKTDKDSFGAYVHGGGKISAVIILEGSTKADAAKDIAMHAAAMAPQYLNRTQVSQDYIKNETELLKKEAAKTGKPDNVIEGMVKGRLNKQLAEICLDDQPFVKEPKSTVAAFAKANGGTISKMVRYSLGEGIEKKEENFAEEVAKQQAAAKK